MTAQVCEEILLASRPLGGGLRQTSLSVPSMHCGGCMKKVEGRLSGLSGVASARANLSTRRVTVDWRDGSAPPPLTEALKSIGFDAYLCDEEPAKDDTYTKLVRALAVAGFASGNIMMLSLSVWSGADPVQRNLFYWLSGIIAFPAIVYSGRIFFLSAWSALRKGRTNMDVPISIGVILAFVMSVYETLDYAEHTYFDAAVSLLFFLLIGRTLDYMMREKARDAVKGLEKLSARGAYVLQRDGAQVYLPLKALQPGMRILLSAGERVPVDARVAEGSSDIDCSLVSGESLPRPVSVGSTLQAGTLNVTGSLTVVALAAAKDSFLAEMTRMMEAAEGGRSAYRRIADRAARLYAPVVHLAALSTGIGWLLATQDIHFALTTAVAVLIITCPCALGLAVPMVQVVAAQRLFAKGIMVRDGSAMERLAEIDTVIFDKTGTLTRGLPRLANRDDIPAGQLELAAALAGHSRHPYSQALAASAVGDATLFGKVREIPGAGLEARKGEDIYRLGRADWETDTPQASSRRDSSVLLSKNGKALALFRFEDDLREGAHDAVARLVASGLRVEILSGDSDAPVQRLAADLGLSAVSNVRPDRKAEYIARLTGEGRKVLMVGDGLNDGPALVTAHASMAPASAADVGRNAADMVFLRDSLMAVPQAIAIARRAERLVRQNFALSIAYNMFAVPVAVMGWVTPLFAAIAMSLSSIVVVANALRLRGRKDASPAHGASVPAKPAFGPVRMVAP